MDPAMKRVQEIWEHPLYQQNLKELTRLEADRIFCRHTPEHFLDVARLAYIFHWNVEFPVPVNLFTALPFSMISAVQNSILSGHLTTRQVPALQKRFSLTLTSLPKKKKRSSLRSASTVLPAMRFQCSASSSTKLTKNPGIVFSVRQNQNATGPRRKKI